MKKMLLACCLALCLLLPALALAQNPPVCGIEGHTNDDGLDHHRPQSCWVTGHFYCDGMDHARAVCGKWGHFNCDGKNHEPAVCGAEGHYSCVKGVHEAAPCGIAGHCISDGKRHVAAACGIEGHYMCLGGQHGAAVCGAAGHTVCDGLAHEKASCGVAGHRLCDGADHALAACGMKGHCASLGGEHALAPCGEASHCTSDGREHAAAPCGYENHLLCDGREHEAAACGVAGHWACEGREHLGKVISEYCNAYPQHQTCEGNPVHYCDPAQGGCGREYKCSNANAHTTCRMCGRLWCDRSGGSHETPCKNANHRPCVYSGKYIREEHEICHRCGKALCKGEHGNGICCDSCPKCGLPEKLGKDHKLDCGHYWCTSDKVHKWCRECNGFACKTDCPHIKK